MLSVIATSNEKPRVKTSTLDSYEMLKPNTHGDCDEHNIVRKAIVVRQTVPKFCKQLLSLLNNFQSVSAQFNRSHFCFKSVP